MAERKAKHSNPLGPLAKPAPCPKLIWTVGGSGDYIASSHVVLNVQYAIFETWTGEWEISVDEALGIPQLEGDDEQGDGWVYDLTHRSLHAAKRECQKIERALWNQALDGVRKQTLRQRLDSLPDEPDDGWFGF